MAYLIQNDYLKQIQPTALKALLQNNYATLLAAQLAAQEEATSYLTQKYDTGYELTDTNPWSNTLSYNAHARVVIDFPLYDATATYATGALIIYNGNGYICTTTISSPEAFTAGHWQLIAPQYTLYYGAYPAKPFDIQRRYEVGDIVFWSNHTYTCLIATSIPDDDIYIQYENIAQVPYTNIFPDNPSNGATYWTDNGAYTIPAASLAAAMYNPVTSYTPAQLATYNNNIYTCTSDTTGAFDITKWQLTWVQGDNRSQQLVLYLIDITLYHLSSNISPQNIPELRHKRYTAAISWLEKTAKGTITANLPKKQPPKGERIRYGGNVKMNNQY